MMNTKRAKQIIIILMVVLLVFMATGMVGAASANNAEDTIRRTKSSQEYDDGIVPLGEIKSEEDYTEWTAAKPVYIPAQDYSGMASEGGDK